MKTTKNLILYRDFENEQLFYDFTWVMENYQNEYYNKEDVEGLFYECLKKLMELAVSHGFSGNLWHNFLAFLLVNNENAYSRACEIRGEVKGSINEVALALKAQLGEAEERITSLEEQVHHLNELLKENNISMGKLYRDCAQNMVAYETGQIGLRGLIQDTAVARADVLQQSADENVRAREAFLKYVSGMQEELAEQKSSADELENVCKSILQSAGEAG